MNFNIHNTRVEIKVLFADDIRVNFLVKPKYMAWREMTQKERSTFTARNHQWTITVKVYGEDDREDVHEVVVTTPINFEGANDVFRQILEAAQEHWPGMVIKRILTTIKPGVIA